MGAESRLRRSPLSGLWHTIDLLADTIRISRTSQRAFTQAAEIHPTLFSHLAETNTTQHVAEPLHLKEKTPNSE